MEKYATNSRFTMIFLSLLPNCNAERMLETCLSSLAKRCLSPRLRFGTIQLVIATVPDAPTMSTISNTFSIHNLAPLNFLRCRYPSPRPSPPPPTVNANPIRLRAQWLAAGLGDAAAHYAAARSFLHSADKTLLIAIIPVVSPCRKLPLPTSRDKEPVGSRRAPAPEPDAELWIFAARRMDNVAADDVLRHVTDFFHVSQMGTWHGGDAEEVVDDAVVAPLVSALHDALHFAFLTHVSALSLGPELLYVPSANVVYRLRLALDRVGGEATVCVNLAILAPRADMRPVEVSDLDTNDVKVLISPVGVHARLVPGRRAGEALAAQVTERWYEAGLGKGEDDEVVVFVSVGNEAGCNPSFPVPMRSLVILKIGGMEDSEGKQGLSDKRKSVGALEVASEVASEANRGNLWHSLKRPRSPSGDVEALERAAKLESVQLLLQTQQPQLVDHVTEAVLSTVKVKPCRSLDASMLDRAISSVLSSKGPPPVLCHPLAVPVGRLGYIDTDGVAGGSSGTVDRDPINSTGDLADIVTQATVSRPGVTGGGTECSAFSFSANGNSVVCSGDGGDGADKLDSLPLGDGSEGGGGFDMDEVGVFDDDVTQFFGGGADGTPSVPAGPSLALEKTASPGALQSYANLPSLAMNFGSPSGGRGVVGKTALRSDPSALNTTSMVDVRGVANCYHSGRDASASWLAMLDEPCIPRGRPSTPQREEQVKTFIDRDVAKRRRGRTRIGRSCSPERQFNKKPRSLPTHDRLQCTSLVAAGDVYYPKRAMMVFDTLQVLSSTSDAPDPDLSTTGDGIISDSSSDAAIEVNSSLATITGGGKEIVDAVVIDVPVLQSDSVSRGGGFLRRAQFAASAVAVDCASACFVILSAEPNFDSCMISPWISGVSLVAKVPSFFESTVNAFVDAETASSGSRFVTTLGKGHRCDSLRPLSEKDEKALESLFQMQIIGAPEIQLLPSTAVPLRVEKPTYDSSDFSKTAGSNIRGDVVVDVSTALSLPPGPRALVRRALGGFSSVFQNGSLLRRESGDNDMDSGDGSETNYAKNVSVSGPLSVNDVSPKTRVPRVCIGYRGDWIETGSGILSLWEKTGLEPFACAKNIQYAALAPKELAEDVRSFFRDVSASYEECSLGRHSAMPFDSLSLIANSVSIPISHSESRAALDKVTTAESRMVQQYHLAAAGLATKLTAVARDARKSDAIGPNFVIYVVSPFARHRRAAIAALFHAVIPLVSCIPNTVVSSGQSPPLPPGLVSSPWRLSSSALPIDQTAQPAPHPQPPQLGMGSSNSPANSALLAQSVSGVALALTVRMLPREAAERYPLDLSNHSFPTRGILRPQVVKSVAFAVYGSLRSRRLRRTMHDSDALCGAHSSESSELLSPMTPDIAMVGSPSNCNVTAGAPLPPSPGIAGDSSTAGATGFLNLDQNLSSFLYDPAFVLAGVGEKVSQTGLSGTAAFHLSYTLIEEQSKCIFAWTDSRGETLDVGILGMLSQSPGLRFLKLFESMWKRGQQWWVPHVNQTCVTIAKVGLAMCSSEKEDWQAVVQMFIVSSNSKVEFAGDRIETRLRFPNMRASGSAYSAAEPEAVDALREAATPATPASMATFPASTSTGSVPVSTGGRIGVESAADAAVTTLRSVTIMSVIENTMPDLATIEATGDFFFLAKSGRNCEAKAVMVVDVALRKNARQLELSMLAHFGVVDTENQPGCEWDGRDAASILRHICANFDGLRTATSPPCWPQQLWLSPYPIHVDAVWNLRELISSFSFVTG